jgi:hypothetical protein
LLSIVQSKTVPASITTTENGTLFLLQQVPGVIALFADRDYNLDMVGSYSVVNIDHDNDNNNNVTDYEVNVSGPGLMEGLYEQIDPRGQPKKFMAQDLTICRR